MWEPTTFETNFALEVAYINGGGSKGKFSFMNVISKETSERMNHNRRGEPDYVFHNVRPGMTGVFTCRFISFGAPLTA